MDVVVETANGEKWIVQCNGWRGTVGEPVVRDLYGVMHHEGAERGAIVTTGTFSEQARDWVKGFAQYIHALAGHSLPKAYEMVCTANADGEKRHTVATAETARSQQDVQFVAWLKFLTFNLIKDFGAAVGKQFAACQVATLVRRFVLRPGRLYLQAGQLIVQLDPFRGHEGLSTFIRHVNQHRLPIPWLADLVLQLEIAPEPQGLAAVPNVLRRRIRANSRPAAPS
jgi:hypothetical protein